MKLYSILEETIPGLGYELVDIECAPSKVIRVFIDKDGGVTIDDCEKVSNHVSKLFFVENIDFNRLEISSPGIERPIKKIDDFRRFIGKAVKVKTREIIDGQKVFLGQIHEVADDKVRLMINNTLLEIDFTNISKARLVFESKFGKK